MHAASTYHVPVMTQEALRLLEPERGGVFVDGTLGGGGHAAAILERGPEAELIGFDRDPEAIEAARDRLENVAPGRFRLFRTGFEKGLEAAGLEGTAVQGVLLDLGISSHQIDEDARGFTFRRGAPLDMRMGESTDTAADLLNSLGEEELADVFYHYGEERRSRRLARLVVERREESPFVSSDDLLDVIDRALGPRTEAQDRARLFQALRIAVNDELTALYEALPRFRDSLAPGGVLAVLAYHSLEDRRVKTAFREWSASCVCPPKLPVCRCRGKPLGTTLTRSPLRPSDAEVARNPRARSARLRGWRKA